VVVEANRVPGTERAFCVENGRRGVVSSNKWKSGVPRVPRFEKGNWRGTITSFRRNPAEDDAMPQSVPPSNSGTIAITVIPQANGRYDCEVTPSLEGRIGPAMRFCGQNPKHAIAVALENLARAYRTEAETEQQIDGEAVSPSTSGKVAKKRFHVILHYERVAEEESKFDALENSLLGNTVVENAEISIIQVDPDLSIQPLARGRS
jgi:hypothetical protein